MGGSDSNPEWGGVADGRGRRYDGRLVGSMAATEAEGQAAKRGGQAEERRQAGA